MTDSHEEASWDELAGFAERQFEGVTSGAIATVDGTLSVVDVRLTRFDEDSPEAIRIAINDALRSARAALAALLAGIVDLDLPPALRELLEGAATPEAAVGVSQDYEASRSGIAVRVDGHDCLIKHVVVPAESHLGLLPEVANAALAAAESRRSFPLHDLFDSSWRDIVAQLDDLNVRLDAILAELGNNGD